MELLAVIQRAFSLFCPIGRKRPTKEESIMPPFVLSQVEGQAKNILCLSAEKDAQPPIGARRIS